MWMTESGMRNRDDPVFLPHSAFWILTAALCILPAACNSKTVEPTPVTATLEEGPAGPPLFEDVTAASGLSFTYRNGEETADHVAILESLGGGVGLIDYDGDGLMDVFVTGGGGYAGPDGKNIVGRPCKLYRNLGNFQFKDVTKEVGLEDFPWFYTHGVAVADYDRDGWPDLLVTGWGRVALFHNEPVDPGNPAKGRRFVEVADSGLDGITWATSAAWADFDGDGYPDVYICQYVDWSLDNNPHCRYYNETVGDVCPPKNFNGLPHKLFANLGGKKFKDVSAEAGLKPGGPDASKGLGVLAVALNGDGKPDIYVCNDTTDKLLYLNQCTPGHFKFDEVGVRSGAARDGRGSQNGSMGVDAGDYDGCGRPSLWVTNYENESHGLYHNDMRPGVPYFHWQTSESGLAAMGQRYVSWGTAFLDVDLDGWEDLFIANGHATRHYSETGAGRKQPPVLFRNLGGTFKDVSRQIGSYHDTDHLARGVGFGDLDNDGRTDLVISHINEPAAVLRGIGGQDSHWLGVQLVGKDFADVVGAKAELQTSTRTLTRFVKGGGSYLSSGDRRLLFGLGRETPPGRLTLTWPNGAKQTFDGLAGDRYYRIVQGQVKAEPYPAKE
jgi:hypothetical protein